jgi:phosphate transport system protein
MIQHRHIDSHYDTEIAQLAERLGAMGNLVELQIRAAVTAFTRRDLGQVLAVERDDHTVNELERSIDERCISLLALRQPLRQPAASDLRLVAAMLKIVTDLERIGDLAVEAARRTRDLDSAPLQNVQDIQGLQDAALLTLRESLDAFLRADLAMARGIIDTDGRMDERVSSLIVRLRKAMTDDSRLVANGVATLMTVMHLQRMAAHARNIAEMAIYTASGVDVRHVT